MKDVAILVTYDTTNLSPEDPIPISNIRRFSQRHESEYFVVIIKSPEASSWPTRTIVRKYDPELFDKINNEIISGEYQKSGESDGHNLYLPNIKENFVYTKLICDFEYGFQPWIQNIRKIDSFSE